MRKKSIYGMFMIALVSIAAFLVGCGGGTLAERAEHIAEHVADELEMNETQSAQLQRSTIKLLEKGQELKDIRTSLAEELITQLRRDQVDQESLNKVVSENRQKLEAMMDLFIEEFSNFHQNLTLEQRAQAAEKIEKFKDRHSHGRWGKWRHG